MHPRSGYAVPLLKCGPGITECASVSRRPEADLIARRWPLNRVQAALVKFRAAESPRE